MKALAIETEEIFAIRVMGFGLFAEKKRWNYMKRIKKNMKKNGVNYDDLVFVTRLTD